MRRPGPGAPLYATPLNGDQESTVSSGLNTVLSIALLLSSTSHMRRVTRPTDYVVVGVSVA